MTNKELYAKTYAEAFKECYPQFNIDQAQTLTIKTLEVALRDIRSVNIDSPGFKLTAKKLGIKNTYKAIDEFIHEGEE